MSTVVIRYTTAKWVEKIYEGKLVAEFGDYFRLYTEGSPKTFRKDRVQAWIKGKDLLEFPEPRFHEKKEKRVFDKNEKCLPEICFTGFKKDDKARLETDAKNAGFYPTKRHVTVGLLALCCGPTAGPKKIEKAQEQGCLILNEKQFYQLIETGEIPED